MNEVMDFEETESLNEDIFDCEYTSVDAVINEVTVFTGCKERQTENGTRTLIAYGEGIGASAFYTDSKKLKDVVLDPKRKYPFRAVIKWYAMERCTGLSSFHRILQSRRG